jgi:hypothetical protein
MKTQTQHTPGPWQVSPYGNITRKSLTVAKVEQMPGNYESERMANARLIATSPELILALESLLSDRSCPSFLTLDEWHNTHLEFRATLRKAKGEA